MKERDANYKLSGMIEMDDAYFGSPRTGTDGRGTTKAKVSVALETDEKGHPLYIRINVIEAVSTKELQRVAKECVVPGSTILSDGLAAYRKLKENYVHIPKDYYAAGENFLKWVHIVISNAKAFVLGTYHGVSGSNIYKRIWMSFAIGSIGDFSRTNYSAGF